MFITISSLPAILTFFLILITTILIYFKLSFTHWKTRKINYLKPSLPFGNAAEFFLGKICFGELFQNWYLEMKKEKWLIGGAFFAYKPVLVPVDNELIKKIIISDFKFFPNHGLFIDERTDPLSTHIFNMEDYKWKNLRAKFPAAFTALKMRKNVIIMEKISHKLINRIEKMTANNESINIGDVLVKFTIDIVTACAFGMESNTLDDQNLELLKQSRPFFDNQFGRTSNSMVILFPRYLLSWFRFKLFPKSNVEYFMNMFKNIKDHRENEKVQRNDLAELLIDLCDETKTHPDFNGEGVMAPLTFNEFASQMLVFFEAGFETSSSTQTLALYELAYNSEIQDKLRQEIVQVLDKYDGKISYDAVNEMLYLDRIVDETLRKYPIFPILPRLCTKDYQIKGTDIVIEKDSFLMITNLGLHHDPEYYPNPHKFDPDRFSPENKAKRPFGSYMPFGEGPRVCVGKRFGIWQTKIGIVSIVRNFKITLSEKMRLPFKFDETGTILKAKGGVWMNMEKISIMPNEVSRVAP